MRERIGTWMTYGGGATATASGVASASASAGVPRTPVLDAVAPHAGAAAQAAGISISDIGVYVGIAVGVIGLCIQAYCALSRRMEERELHQIMKRRLRDPKTALTINDNDEEAA